MTARLIIATFLLAIAVNADETNWNYQVLADEKVIDADSIERPVYANLAEFDDINVAGFRTARIYVKLLESDFANNQGRFTKDSTLRVSCYHKTSRASSLYLEGKLPMKVTTYISGWIEVPIIGPNLRVLLTGDNIPETEMKLDCTIYLLK